MADGRRILNGGRLISHRTASCSRKSCTTGSLSYSRSSARAYEKCHSGILDSRPRPYRDKTLLASYTHIPACRSRDIFLPAGRRISAPCVRHTYHRISHLRHRAAVQSPRITEAEDDDLASQPTLSRFENSITPKSLLRLDEFVAE